VLKSLALVTSGDLEEHFAFRKQPVRKRNYLFCEAISFKMPA
jgi:hypothetical protein